MTSSTKKTRRNVLELSYQEARHFFLKSESYCSLKLPPQFIFGDLIAEVDKILNKKKLTDFSSNPRAHDDINYTILNNKDGKYAWRPFQLIHPALYVSLVHKITEKKYWQFICNRFKEFKNNEKIQCHSLPVKSLSEKTDKEEQILQWCEKIE